MGLKGNRKKRDSGLEGHRKEGFRTLGIQEKRDAGKKGFRTGGIQKKSYSGLEGYRKRVIQVCM